MAEERETVVIALANAYVEDGKIIFGTLRSKRKAENLVKRMKLRDFDVSILCVRRPEPRGSAKLKCALVRHKAGNNCIGRNLTSLPKPGTASQMQHESFLRTEAKDFGANFILA